MSCEKIIPVDSLKIAKVALKTMSLLRRRTKNAGEAYLASKFLTIYFETTHGFRVLPSDEKELTDLVKEFSEGFI